MARYLSITDKVKKLFHLLYVGTYFAKMHIVSYIASIVNSLLWFSLVYIPMSMFTPDPITTLKTFLPGIIGFTSASIGMWVATEFLRWYVYQGLTDLFRECGLNIFHYLVCGVHIDLSIEVVLSYFAIAFFVAGYIGIDITLILPQNIVLFIIALVFSIAVYLFYGALAAYLYTVTPIHGAWTNIFQMIVVVGTIIPPKILPNPELALLNPATIVSELARASYNTNSIDIHLILVLTPILGTIYILSAYALSRYCEAHISRHGIMYRV